MLLAFTVGRLLLVPVMILSLDHVPALTAASLAIFIALDLYDGVLARRLDADDPARRALDSVVDRVAIWAVYGAATVAGLLPVIFLALLLVRDLYCAYWCYRLVSDREVAIRADWMYRLLNVSLAMWIALAPLVPLRMGGALFVGVLAFSAVVARDLRLSVLCVLRSPDRFHSGVIPAGALRAMRSGHASRRSRPPVASALGEAFNRA